MKNSDPYDYYAAYYDYVFSVLIYIHKAHDRLQVNAYFAGYLLVLGGQKYVRGAISFPAICGSPFSDNGTLKPLEDVASKWPCLVAICLLQGVASSSWKVLQLLQGMSCSVLAMVYLQQFISNCLLAMQMFTQ